MESYRTYLYAVRDSPSLRVKFGYITAPDIRTARRQLHSRYSTYYYSCELLHAVPVAQKGVDAEAGLKARLPTYCIGREFLLFPDEPTLRSLLLSTFEEAACAEDEAARRQSRRGATDAEKKRTRQEAELAAAVEVAIIAKRRKLDKSEAADERRRVRNRQRSQKSEGLKEKKATEHVAQQHGVAQWLVKRISIGNDKDFIAKRELEEALRSAGISFRPLQLKKRVDELFKSGGAHCKAQHFADGVRHLSAWIKLKWV